MVVENRAFGVDFYMGNKEDLLAMIKHWTNEPYRYIVTPNVDHLALLEESQELSLAYHHAELRVCDSRVLQPLLKRLGVHIEEVICGSDLTIDVLKMAEAEHWGITIIGSTDEEIAKLKAIYPNITIYHHNPPMGFIKNPDEVEKAVNFVVNAPSEIVFYAVGAPRQEQLAYMVSKRQRTGVGFCIGASISFATGSIKRAPVWMQKAKIEWLHRMCTDPGRLVKRYWKDLVFIIPAYLKAKFAHPSANKIFR